MCVAQPSYLISRTILFIAAFLSPLKQTLESSYLIPVYLSLFTAIVAMLIGENYVYLGLVTLLLIYALGPFTCAMIGVRLLGEGGLRITYRINSPLSAGNLSMLLSAGILHFLVH